MFGKFAALALLATAAVAAPASAQSTVTFDAFSSFNGTQGVSHFTYGTFNTGTQGFAAFTQNTGCQIGGTICLRGTSDNSTADSYLGVYKSNGTATTSGTVIIPNDRLIFHPGEGNNAVYAAFTAPVAGSYTYSAQYNQQDSNTARHSVFIQDFGPEGGNPLLIVGGPTVDQDNPVGFGGYTFDLKAGDRIGIIVENNGSNFFDSTGVQFSVFTNAVPEPSTWAMMIVGFGMVGGSLRRRKSATLATA